MLGGFVDGLTGAGDGALWDGGHCSCEHWVANVWCYAESPAAVGGIIRVRTLEHLKVSFVKFAKLQGLYCIQLQQQW